MSYVIGIDPGKSGALVLWDSDERRLYIDDMPLLGSDIDLVGLDSVIGSYKAMCLGHRPIVYIEKVGGIGSQSASRSFTFGFVTGAVHAVSICKGLVIKTVTPQRWKGSFGLIRGINETQPQFKTRSRALAATLVPEYAHFFKRAKDDGRAEAFLIAFYGAAIEG